jgi:hypothetical protein
MTNPSPAYSHTCDNIYKKTHHIQAREISAYVHICKRCWDEICIWVYRMNIIITAQFSNDDIVNYHNILIITSLQYSHEK